MDCVPRGFFCDFSPPPFPHSTYGFFHNEEGKEE